MRKVVVILLFILIAFYFGFKNSIDNFTQKNIISNLIKYEGNDYYFYCSYNQIIHYFKRFGSNAIIISPNDLFIKMKNYYFSASKKYLSFAKKKNS